MLTILTPRIALAKGFHDDGGGDFGGDHIVFHDDDSGAGHDDFDDGDDSVTSDDGETQSFGSRVKDTFNCLIPQDSSYSHVSSGVYSKNQSTALNQLIEGGYELIELILGSWMSCIVLVDFLWEDLQDKVKDLISSILTSKDLEKIAMQ